MVSATFVFKPGEYDDEFFSLGKAIEDSNMAKVDFLGNESWPYAERRRLCGVYYYKSMKGVSDLRNIQAHRVAKSQYSKWYEGYQVIIAEISRSYGYGSIQHPTPTMDYYRKILPPHSAPNKVFNLT